MTAPVFTGDYNYIGNRVTFLKGSATARVTVGAGSICVKDYRALGENIMIAGNPAGLVIEYFPGLGRRNGNAGKMASYLNGRKVCFPSFQIG